MFEELTAQQRDAVTDRGGNLLVSAAAGSGKTKVLVDRLLSYILDPVDPANIDEFLIITYTKAAASELRAKIAEKLSEVVAKYPQNRHLHRQMQRLYLTKISTVHSFCAEILKENAYQLDLSADFRMAEDTECEQMQVEVLNRILDDAYENIEQNPDLKAFVDTQGLGRDDRAVPEIVQKVYLSARCHKNPRAWLQKCVDATQISHLQDAGETESGAYLIQDLHTCVSLHLDALKRCYSISSKTDGMQNVDNILTQDIQLLEVLLNCTTWNEIHAMSNISWPTYPRKYSDKDLSQHIKAVRDACKESINKKLTSFINNSQQTLADLEGCNAAVRGLIYLVERFSDAYDSLKRNHHVMDFSDLEHSTLDLLLGKNRSGHTTIAKEIGMRFREIMVDEYQDSNAVQDAIFNALTCQRNNCFMVGDVKQSIYQFRLAEPKIFLDKYKNFADKANATHGEPRKVILSKNFRSANQVVNAVNDVFSYCMSPQVGGLEYGPDEMLSEGRSPRLIIDEPEIELHALSTQRDTYAEEAAFTAQRIKELLDGQHQIRTRDGFKPIDPEDIVILLRSPGSVGMEFCYALQDIGIPCSMGGGEDLLETEEIGVLYALLQTISNPLQDIPLVATVSSRIFAFTADDLAEIRGQKKYLSFYDSLKWSDNPKAKAFLGVLDDFRRQSRMCSITQLIDYIFAKTRIDSVYAAMGDGKKRIANIQEFCRMAASCESNGKPELEHFLEHLEALSQKGMVVSSDQNATGAVTVMSIHKSKGLEFPVVFLCGLARKFNQRSAQEQVLCDKDLGLGLSCVNQNLRVRYPSIAKRAISLKIKTDGISEEMRVLYVALTRAKDRLIMTYASQYLESALSGIASRIDMSSRSLMTAYVSSPGQWILQCAMTRTEAGELHALGGHPACTEIRHTPWKILVHDVCVIDGEYQEITQPQEDSFNEEDFLKIQKFLKFKYAHTIATTVPSKQTATQIKQSTEQSENNHSKVYGAKFRKPSFVETTGSGITYGNAVHTLMQHIDFQKCTSVELIQDEINRLMDAGYLSSDLAVLIEPKQIDMFFQSDIGQHLCRCEHVLREFRFSIMDDAEKYAAGAEGEHVLLQGVIDCAMVEDDGITIVDFKTDKVTTDTLETAVSRYTPQLMAYSTALSRIYGKKIKGSYLYFFHLNTLIKL